MLSCVFLLRFLGKRKGVVFVGVFLPEELGDISDPEWATVCKPKGKAAAANVPADDQDFKLLQESFDSVSRVTLSIKRASQSLIACGGGVASGSSDMARRGVKLCQDLYLYLTVIYS